MSEKRFIVQVADEQFYKSAAPAGDPFSATQFTDKGDAGAIAKAKKGKLFFLEPKPEPSKKDESWVWVMWLILICVVMFRDPASLAALQRLARLEGPPAPIAPFDRGPCPAMESPSVCF